jgi:thiamine-phosphate pyrophosphorylase
MGSQNCNSDPVQVLKEAIAGGITAFQFREKGTGSLRGDAKLKLGKQLRDVCFEHHIPFFINDDIDLVEPLHVDGIHVGQEDISVEELRRIYPQLLIGLSVSNEQELFNSSLSIIDYIGAGPVYATNTKSDAKKAVGIQWIQTVRRKYPDLPIVGIGGITTINAASVMEAGADGVSVISVITNAKNIKKTVKAL